MYFKYIHFYVHIKIWKQYVYNSNIKTANSCGRLLAKRRRKRKIIVSYQTFWRFFLNRLKKHIHLRNVFWVFVWQLRSFHRHLCSPTLVWLTLTMLPWSWLSLEKGTNYDHTNAFPDELPHTKIFRVGWKTFTEVMVVKFSSYRLWSSTLPVSKQLYTSSCKERKKM